MSKYYCLIAGLPQIALDDSKPFYTVASFKEEIGSILTRGDQKLIDLFFLKYDNKNLLEYLKNPDYTADERGNFALKEFQDVITAFKKRKRAPKGTRLPSYLIDFLTAYVAGQAKEEQEDISWEDRLAALYFAHAMKCRNKFVADWFELNLNINNVLTALTCRKYGLDKAKYIVGDNDVANTLRKSVSRDFGLGDKVDYLPELQRITEEKDLMVREKKVDSLKWKWLEEKTFFKIFDIESVYAYLLELEMVERWATLDKAAGEKTFREIVGAMKKGSENALEEFKRNNEK